MYKHQNNPIWIAKIKELDEVRERISALDLTFDEMFEFFEKEPDQNLSQEQLYKLCLFRWLNAEEDRLCNEQYEIIQSYECHCH